MIISAGILTISAGVLCISDDELAWNLYELDSRMIGIQVERPRNWRNRVYFMGLTLMLMGMVTVGLGLGAI